MNGSTGKMFAVAIMAALLIAAGHESEEVANYGDRVSVELTEAETAGMRALAEAVTTERRALIAIDPRLVVVAREMAGEIQNDLGRQMEILSSYHTSELLRRYGVYETSTRATSFTFLTVDDIRSTIALHIKSDNSQSTYIGVGVAPPGGARKIGVCVVIMSTKRVQLDPFPRSVEVPSTVSLKGKLVNGVRGFTPRVLLTSPDGNVSVIEVEGKHDRFLAQVPFDKGPGLYHLEVVAVKKDQSVTAALMLISAGRETAEVPYTVAPLAREPQSEKEAEQMMVVMINEARRNSGLGPLAVDPRLTDMARAHSRDMKDHRFFSHLSPDRGSLEQRSRTAGLARYRTRENLALNTSLTDAMNNLLASPVHREAILSRDVTHVGVGVAFDDSSGTRHYYVTQDFAAIK